MYRNGKNHPQVTCSFCGKPAEQVEKMITGAGVHICSDCVIMCHRILEEDLSRGKQQEAASSVMDKPLRSPRKSRLILMNL